MEKLNKNFKQAVELFLIDNYKGHTTKGYNNLCIEFDNNIFSMTHEKFEVEYRIDCLESNVVQNCGDNVFIYHDDFKVTVDRADAIINSKLFRTKEKELLEIINNIEDLLLRYIDGAVQCDEHGDETGEYYELSSDDIKSAYEIFSNEVIEGAK